MFSFGGAKRISFLVNDIVLVSSISARFSSMMIIKDFPGKGMGQNGNGATKYEIKPSKYNRTCVGNTKRLGFRCLG